MKAAGILVATSMLTACPRNTVAPTEPALVTVEDAKVSRAEGYESPPRLVERIDDLALTLDGSSLWLCANGRVRRWSWAAEPSARFELQCPRGLRISAEGDTIVTPGDRVLWVHGGRQETATRRFELEMEPDDQVTDVALSLRGRRAAVSTRNGALEIIDLDSGHVKKIEVSVRPGVVRSTTDDSTFGRLDVDREIAIPQIRWSGDETTLVLVAAIRDVEAERVRGRVFLWNLADATHRASEPFEVVDRRLRGHLAIAASPVDRRVAVGTAEGAIRLFDRHRLVWESPAATAYPTALAFSVDGRHLAVAYADGAVRIFGPVGTADAVELWPEAGEVASIAFSAGGDRVLLGVDDGLVVIIDARTGELLGRLAVLDRGWVAVSARGTVDGDPAGLNALRHGPIADVLGWDRGQLPAPHQVSGLLGELL